MSVCRLQIDKIVAVTHEGHCADKGVGVIAGRNANDVDAAHPEVPTVAAVGIPCACRVPRLGVFEMTVRCDPGRGEAAIVIGDMNQVVADGASMAS